MVLTPTYTVIRTQWLHDSTQGINYTTADSIYYTGLAYYPYLELSLASYHPKCSMTGLEPIYTQPVGREVCRAVSTLQLRRIGVEPI